MKNEMNFQNLDTNNYTENKEKPKLGKFSITFIALLMVTTLIFAGYLIYDSFDKINQLYRVINAGLIIITVITTIIALKRAYKYPKTKALGISAILLICLMLFNIFSISGIIKLPEQTFLPNFQNKSLTEVLEWTEKNNITTNQTFEYSDNTKKYNIMSQDKMTGTLIKNIKKLNLQVSNGPDFTKEVIISDMTGQNIDEAVEIIDENFLNNVDVSFEENNEIKRDIIIEQNIKGNIKRNDKLNFKVSLGTKENLQPIKLKNLVNTSLFKATLYLNRNAIEYELKYDFSKKIEKGNIISQSIKQGETVSPNDKITLTVSKGKKIIVPDFTNKKLSEVTKWAITNNLKINYDDKYNDKIKNGRVIEATYKKGEIIEEDTTVGIIVSKGKLKMPKFKSVNDFKSWAEKYKIKYEIKEEFDNDIKQGEIIKFSKEQGKTIKEDETIIAYVSKGKAIKVPSFIGETKENAKNTCNKLKLVCTFETTYDPNKKENSVINQSIKEGEEVKESSSITLTIATKNKNEETKKEKKTNNSSSSSNTTNSGSTSTNNTSNNESNCQNYELNLGTGNNGEQTIKLTERQNPNLKFSWNKVSTCPNGDSAPGTICSSSVADGTNASSCTTIKITYIN
ncbi:MAG: PASTA domain-containing protein [Bacilli bacterium]|nr:PASTA domain-containing protein [Bacilli bacterium]